MKATLFRMLALAGFLGAGTRAEDMSAPAAPSPGPLPDTGATARSGISEIQVGFTRDQVLDALGHPTGVAQINADWEILFYDRGRVDLKQGAVEQFELVSPEELARRKARAERAWQDYQRSETLRRAQARKQGERVKQQMLNDPDFLALSYSEQADGWREFMRAYPDVTVGDIYQAVLEKARAEGARASEARKLAELEARTAEAEARAAEAERKAEEARRTIYVPPYYVYPYPVTVYPQPPRRPPKAAPGSGAQVQVSGPSGSITVQGQTRGTSTLSIGPAWPYNFGGSRSTIRLGRDAEKTNPPRNH